MSSATSGPCRRASRRAARRRGSVRGLASFPARRCRALPVRLEDDHQSARLRRRRAARRRSRSRRGSRRQVAQTAGVAPGFASMTGFCVTLARRRGRSSGPKADAVREGGEVRDRARSGVERRAPTRPTPRCWKIPPSCADRCIERPSGPKQRSFGRSAARPQTDGDVAHLAASVTAGCARGCVGRGPRPRVRARGRRVRGRRARRRGRAWRRWPPPPVRATRATRSCQSETHWPRISVKATRRGRARPASGKLEPVARTSASRRGELAGAGTSSTG